MAGNGARDRTVALQTLVVVLRPAPVLTVLATAVVLTAALRTAPFGLPLAGMVLFCSATHAIATLHALGAGAREIPVLSLEMILGTLQGWRSFLAMLVLVGLLFATGAAAFWIGPVAALVAGGLAALVLPITLLIIGWTNNFGQALNPSNWMRLARTLGGDFLQLEAVGIALIVAVAALLSSDLHMHLAIRIAVLILGWLLLVVAVGIAMHARRADLAALMPFHAGIEIEPSPEELARRRQQAIDAIYALWRNGVRLDAWQAVERQAAVATAPDAELRWIYKCSLAWDAAELSARIAQELIGLDLLAGRTGYAMNLAREQLAASQKFRPRTAQQTLELAQLAARCAEPAIALVLLDGFDGLTTDAALLAEAQHLREALRS